MSVRVVRAVLVIGGKVGLRTIERPGNNTNICLTGFGIFQ